MAAPGLFDLELQEEDAIECDQSDDDAIEVEEVRSTPRGALCPPLACHAALFVFGCTFPFSITCYNIL